MRHAGRHPWSLCKGNIDENLSKLAAGECPTEETAKKVWTLTKINIPRAALDASHGAMSTRQAHASDSISMRMHKAYGDATMRDRAFAFQARVLLVPSEFQRKAQMPQDRLQRLLKRNPNKLGAVQASVGDLISIALPEQNAGEVLLHEGGCKRAAQRGQ